MEVAPDPPTVGWLGEVAVLVPVKAFGEAKLRLAPVLAPGERAALARRMATRVLRSAGGLPAAVVCDDREVAGWARQLGALVIWSPGRGLNRAVQDGVAHLGRAGTRRVVVAAGDLPLADDLPAVAGRSGVVLVPDRRGDGTNVISVPTRPEFRFSYGPGSFARHLEEAVRLGGPVEIVDSPRLALDVDWPSDLAEVSSV